MEHGAVGQPLRELERRQGLLGVKPLGDGLGLPGNHSEKS
jgi:hypothetical protein